VHGSLCRWSLGTACVVQCVSTWLIVQVVPRYSLCGAVCVCVRACTCHALKKT
ncbi:predicted protein, partial [Nematostella vectensis]